MNRRDLLAYALVALGVLALLARLTGGAGWIWIALVAGALLAAYVQQRTYGFLLLGGVLGGTAIGLLLQQASPRLDGVFLIALGAGLFAVDRVEPREPRWPRAVGLGLAGLGFVLALLNAGVLSSAWFALLLIAVGVLLLWLRREAGAFPPPQVHPGVPAGSPLPVRPAAPPAPVPPAVDDASGSPSAVDDASEAPSTANDVTEPRPETG